MTNLQQEEITKVEEKTKNPGFQTLIRIVASSPTKARSEAILNGVYNLRYIDKIIYEWTKKRIKNNNLEDFTQVFDYNYLEEDNEAK